MPSHFIIAGFQRCGTTWLARNLANVSDIEMTSPMFPEPKYFLRDNYSKMEYEDLFFKGSDKEVYGEKSTSYSDHIGTAAKIKDTLPNAKAILCLRNPIYRALSNYFFSVKHGYETRKLHEVFCENPLMIEGGSSKYFWYLQRGCYSEIVTEYMSTFDQDLLLLNFRQMKLESQSTMKKVLDFIGINIEEEDLQVNAFVDERAEKHIPNEVLSFLRDFYSEENENLIRLTGFDLRDMEVK